MLVLGVLLYVFLVGLSPFLGATENETCANIAAATYTIPATASISENAQDLISKLLAVDPQKRLSAIGGGEIERRRSQPYPPPASNPARTPLTLSRDTRRDAYRHPHLALPGASCGTGNFSVEMGRKRKTLDDWCKEHEDLQIATKDSEGTRTLVCKYCNTEMVTDPAKKPYDRIREHLMSSRHKKFKTASKEAETAGTSQQTLFDMSCRQRAKETEADGVIHDFVRALAYSGISMHQADGPLGDFARKYCKAAKTMPTGQRLRLKYLKEAFDKDMEKIRDDMRDVKVSVIVDESPDITGVPTINTLLCYYSQKNVKKHVVLVDVDRVNASNSYTVASAVSKALLTVGKTWKDVVAVAKDSAEYMRKMNAEHESERSDATLLTASDSGGTAMVSGSLDIANFVEKQVDNFSKSVAKALESISTWTEMHSLAKAKTLLAAIKDGEFLVTIICLADMLAHTLPLSRLFQRQCIDVRTAKNALVDTMAVLDKRRVDSAETFSQLYKDAVVLADELETEIRELL
ncbi:hypothetical protein HPB52_010516 [Rhipicephalus sanguineus]|uniref:Protein kinase domain-containing protein n=1 Tax=Rhipicephalus sanguineus TaxID=34632 RepID=A0A9D4T9C2_RHISA|nr:hypothetical protein HPB52_010516 [Rhipicephalus sanguineus]